MKSILLKIQNDYANLSTHPTKSDPLYEYMKSQAPTQFKRSMHFDNNDYFIKLSSGIGNKAHIPWIGIIKENVNYSPEKGLYIVYLFKRDLSGVYISLNQGTSYLKKTFVGKKPREKIIALTSYIRNTMIDDSSINSDYFNEFEIDLGVDKKSNSSYYENSHICGKYYLLNEQLDEKMLQTDFYEMLKIYDSLCSTFNNLYIDSLLLDLLSEETNDSLFQTHVQNSKASETEEVPQTKKSPKSNKIGSDSWPRDPSISKEAIQKANYLCEFDENHKSFISHSTNKNFVEAHHLIPMKKQGFYEFSIDVPGNIVALCPNCHRQIHHGEKQSRIEMLSNLYEKRKNRLDNFGIQTTFNELKKYYN